MAVGRAHVWTPVTFSTPVSRVAPEKVCRFAEEEEPE
eukprot:COSAG01_NODE_66525_length_270_cov_0.245614_1_plen_36_part_01